MTLPAREYLEGVHRRRAAAHRLAIRPCGCSDPWLCQCYEPESEITDQFVDGYRDACEHLIGQGLAPAPYLPAMRLMWQRGGDEQRLAIRIAEVWEVA
ncbi:hypothetical protein [Mycolicibacter algericus]|uniref:hypothetical protein n=1 Tax=Mycolicibacter algericus TaxID=1288388 RepID=UPI003C7889CD